MSETYPQDRGKSLETEEIQIDTIEASPHPKLPSLYRKLDFRIIPALWTLYFATMLCSLSYGLTLTMNREQGHSLIQHLNLSTHDLALASSLETVAFIVFDLPMNLIMTKVAPQAWLARIVITVGLVYCFYHILNNAPGLIVIRVVSGVVGAGIWPGMSYYISLWYPNEIMTRRVGYYFTAAQIAAAAAGLISAGVQKMDGVRGYYGWQWMYLIYGVVTIAVGVSLLWWLPDRPFVTKQELKSKIVKAYRKFFTPPYPFNEHEKELHRRDLDERRELVKWGWRDVIRIIADIRIWPIIIMYFGVVGTGMGLAVFGSVIISVQNPSLSSIQVSLLYAPIWLFDLGGILTITPFADRFRKLRPVIFSGACVVIITGMLVTTYAHGPWNKYAGLLIAGFGLGPTVPICMSWSSEIFGRDYGDVGSAVSAALVSGLGNLGTVTATYALYSGWPADEKRMFRDSNMMLVLMLGVSIIASGVCYLIKDKMRWPKK
ncbi:Vitamin H transporter 1 [Candida viswanathii]|uniref:Vitamin H transporter 1 n=1 Tax=Candida viswanathii TaxID=5486 RepID=A0A367XZ48_9ASCO|nr:Vitamin H transporter 1 [Candida viswanathii]